MFKSFKKMFKKNASSDDFIVSLKSKGLDIGNHCYFFDPDSVIVDVQRPHMLHIGNYVKVTSGVKILCHDYSRSVLCNVLGMGNVGECESTFIGDNVFIGMNALILMGSHIGNNCIIGGGSVVKGFFPDDKVIAGNPAKIICSIDEFYKKRKEKELNEAKLYVKKFREKNKRNPSVFEMTNAFCWLYLPRNKETLKEYSSLFKLNGVNDDVFICNFMNSKPTYDSFDDFLNDC